MDDTATPRKLYAIMRYAKIKSFTALDRVCKHNTRAISGENIREDGPPPIELLEHGSEDFVGSAHALLDELGIDRASLGGKVLAVETVTTASRGWFDNATDEEKQAWLDTNVDWAREKFGRGLMTAKLHLDEEVWHIHFVALPVVEKQELPRGKKPKDPIKLADYERRKAAAPMKWTLSYHDVLGGVKERFSREQDAYHAAVAHLGLERGEVQRDDVEIELGDELTISALELSRGYDADGRPRPRRNLPPAEQRAAVKRLKSEAEATKIHIEAVQKKMEAEQAAALAARAHAERLEAEAEDHLDQALRQHDEANAAVAAAAHTREVLATQQAQAEERRRTLEADRASLDAALFQAEQDRQELFRLREKAIAEADLAEHERRAAIKERDAMAAERQSIAQEKAELDARQRRQNDEIELLARGADDSNRLQLKPHDKAFTMVADAMTDHERQVYRGRWTSSAVKIGHQLALALERIRRIAADLLWREKRVEVREKEIERRETAMDEHDRRHAAAAVDLERQRQEQRAGHETALRALHDRDQELDRRAAMLDEQEAALQQQAVAAKDLVAGIDHREAEHRDWMIVINGAADGSLIGSFRDDEGYFRMGRAAKAPPESIARTIASKPPAWAADMLRLVDATFRDRGAASLRVMQINDQAEELADMIETAKISLPAAQQPLVDTAAQARQDIAKRQERLSNLDVPGRSV